MLLCLHLSLSNHEHSLSERTSSTERHGYGASKRGRVVVCVRAGLPRFSSLIIAEFWMWRTPDQLGERDKPCSQAAGQGVPPQPPSSGKAATGTQTSKLKKEKRVYSSTSTPDSPKTPISLLTTRPQAWIILLGSLATPGGVNSNQPGMVPGETRSQIKTCAGLSACPQQA